MIVEEFYHLLLAFKGLLLEHLRPLISLDEVLSLIVGESLTRINEKNSMFVVNV